jgi:hypothetical protein
MKNIFENFALFPIAARVGGNMIDQYPVGTILRKTISRTKWTKKKNPTQVALGYVLFADVNTGTAFGRNSAVLRATPGDKLLLSN